MIPADTPWFIHSDIARGMIAAKRCNATIDPKSIQQSLMSFLTSGNSSGQAGLIFPAFNYDYGRTRVFNVLEDPVQVGGLPEWVRAGASMPRTHVPFFSFLSSRDLALDTRGEINPFGKDSGFQWLVDHDATIVLFGAPLLSLTFIHYVEEVSGGPVYRYIKQFPGKVVGPEGAAPCDFAMHVRPMGVHMDYDWPRLEEDLRNQNILQTSETAPTLQWLNARRLLEYWGGRISSDPLYLLDEPSRSYFGPVTQNGTGRVRQEDFENE
ncbi:MAG: AAC(3) family N-acetyltransferase [Pseudomonadota bacterium]